MSIEISGLHKNFKNKIVLLDISLGIHPYETCYLLGMNGSGKTTFINAILDLIPINKGEILFDGKSIHQVRNNVSVLFDECYFYRNLSVLSNLEILSQIRVINDEFQQQLFDALKIDRSFLKSKAGNLSLGERHKLSLMIALIRKPKYLLLDEPFIGLDYTAMMIFSHLLSQVKQDGCSILVTGQNYNQISDISDRIVVLSDHKIVSQHKTSELKNTNDFILETVKSISQI